MKLSIFIFVIAGNLFFISCKKTHTCNCESDQTTTTTITPRSSGQPSTTTTNQSTKNSVTLDDVNESDLTRLYNCNTRTESSSETNTTTIVVNTVSQTVVGGVTYTYNTSVSQTADRHAQYDTDYTCEIK
ncbi:hypothetical protein [Aurantibacillus circumpalustris]|uniref:hypothetical protein n=1 Tax=Aurantibacillus circumpalustris TaxID=3036359 RepID=UPI00295A60D1|nr:hypothetical protein [Aurantibacillus circumpalustris]